MATNNNLICYEEATVSEARKGKSYIVDLDMDGYSFYIDKEMVKDISIKSSEDEAFIAIILAYIEYARKCRNADNNKKVKALDKEILNVGILILLQKYAAERVIDIIKELKWHEISRVLESKDPLQELEEII